ncbi:MAG: phosphoadenosine phosphosulfate reductase family protein [Thauera sp.]|nr:phosphoadenosine phosphosulfate reductase family protein [Thauera sp.]
MPVQAFLFPEFQTRLTGHQSVGEFSPIVIAEAPEDLRAMPEDEIEEKIAKAKAVLKWLLSNHSTCFSTSYGKDSSCTLGLALATAAELVRDGLPVQPFVVLTCDTKVDNPLIAQLARDESAKVRAWIERFGLPGSVHFATPSLANEFAVAILGGRALPSMAGHKRDCTTSWKTEPLSRLRKRLLGRNKPAAGQFVVSVTGVRRSESIVRAGNLMKRAEAADRLVQTNTDGNIAIAPIIEWSYDDVFTYLGMCSNGLEETYSDFARVIEIYREATGECVIAGSDSNRTAAACGSRTGCFTCLAVKNDRSMDQMVKEPHNAFMRPLAAFRTFLANTFHDLSRRTWVGRSIDENGYIRFAVDGYSPAMLQELLRIALTIDIEEREAAARLGIEPRFQIVSMEALLAISAHWSLQGFALPYTALALYRQIERGARYPVPEVPEAPKVPIPPARYIHVGRGWNEGHAFMYTGLRDVMIDAFGGQGCIGQREIVTKGERRTIMDVANSDMFSIDAEGAALFMQFELDRVVDEWHGPGARRGLLIEGHHVAGIEYRHYASWGFLSVAKGQEGKVDEILRRTAWRERLGLAGYQYEHERALAMSVEASVPITPSPEDVLAKRRAEVAACREAKRQQVRQQRVSLADLHRDWAPDVSWRRLVQQGRLIMPAIPRAKNGRLVLRHLISRYAFLSFLQENPLVMQRVRQFRTLRNRGMTGDFQQQTRPHKFEPLAA